MTLSTSLIPICISYVIYLICFFTTMHIFTMEKKKLKFYPVSIKISLISTGLIALFACIFTARYI